MTSAGQLLQLDRVHVDYDMGQGMKVRAVSDVSLELFRGETLGLVGESGCGKSSLARAVMQMPRPTSGRVLFKGQDLTQLSGIRMANVRPRLQMVFQDALGALNPRRSVGASISMPLRVLGTSSASERAEHVRQMMLQVGIEPAHFCRRPHEFSGGQCQRIQIARALITRPELLICDEPVSALDVSVQAQILSLLEDIRRQYQLTLIFISHDLAVIKNISDRVAVMYLGKVCEVAPSEPLFLDPAHPYTTALISAIPEPNPRAIRSPVAILPGELPSPMKPISGCYFSSRCPKAQAVCRTELPLLRQIANGHKVACHFPDHAVS